MKKLLLLFILAPFIGFSQTDVYTVYGQGIQAFYKAQYDEAIYHFDNVIELKEDFLLAYYYRGLSNQKSNRYEVAIEDFTKAIEIDSTYKDALVKRAETNLLFKKYSEAASDYEKLIVLNPEFHKFYKELGLSYYYLRLYELSDIAYGNYLSVAKDDFNTHFQRGMANFYGNNFKQAIEDFTAVLIINPEYYSALDMRGSSYQRYNLIDKACADWESARKKGYTYSDENFKKYCIVGQ